MTTLPFGELKAQLSAVLEKVKHGELFRITYGRKKRAVAMIVSYSGPDDKKEREIGVYDGKVTVVFTEDFKMTEEELLVTK